MLLELENRDRRVEWLPEHLWNDKVLDFLVKKTEFVNGFALDGGARCIDVLRQHMPPKGRNDCPLSDPYLAPKFQQKKNGFQMLEWHCTPQKPSSRHEL